MKIFILVFLSVSIIFYGVLGTQKTIPTNNSTSETNGVLLEVVSGTVHHDSAQITIPIVKAIYSQPQRRNKVVCNCCVAICEISMPVSLENVWW